MLYKLIRYLLVAAIANLIITPVYADENSPLFPVFVCKNNFGFINSSGQLVIKPQFSWVDKFSNGRAGVITNHDVAAVIDSTGKFVATNITSGTYSEGLALYSPGNSYDADSTPTFGFIDSKGKIIIPAQYSSGYNFSDGLAAVQMGKKWGYIDHQGKFVIKPSFDAAQPFNDGLAAVTTAGQSGYIDKTGKFVIYSPYQINYSFSNNIARVLIGKKYSFIDKTGKLITDQQFDDADDFSDGLGKVKVGNLWGYLNSNGKLALKPQYSWGTNFSEGWAAVIPMGQKDFVYIDHAGKIMLHPQSTYVLDLSKISPDENVTPDNTQGKTHITLDCSYSKFENGLASMDCGDPGAYEKMGYINKSGKIVWEPANSCANPPSGP